MAIDYGGKRTGIAVTDPMKIIASPLDTIPTDRLLTFLDEYMKSEEVECLVVGMPLNLQNQDTHATAGVRAFIEQLHKKFEGLQVETVDERYTSKMAMDAMIAGGMKKKDRRKKENIDKISAAIILQSYLDSYS